MLLLPVVVALACAVKDPSIEKKRVIAWVSVQPAILMYIQGVMSVNFVQQKWKVFLFHKMYTRSILRLESSSLAWNFVVVALLANASHHGKCMWDKIIVNLRILREAAPGCWNGTVYIVKFIEDF